MNDDKRSSNSDAPKSDRAKPYSSPKLTDFGTVTQLTQTNNKRITLDGIGTMMGDGPMSMAS